MVYQASLFTRPLSDKIGKNQLLGLKLEELIDGTRIRRIS
jgi:hypothetical protein